MKTIKTLIVFLLITSCSKTDDFTDYCGCTKTTYYYKDISTEYIQYEDTYIINVENNVCGDSTFKKPTETPYVFYTIKCN